MKKEKITAAKQRKTNKQTSNKPLQQIDTPFYLNLNTGVEYSAVWGPTGAGKSTLLNFL
jgi:ABC-type lipoprotein export system ATPase subunit